MSPLVVLIIFNLSLLIEASDEHSKFDLKSMNGWKLRRILTDKLHGALTEIDNVPETFMKIAMRIDTYLLGSESTDFLEHYVASSKKVNPIDMLKDFAEFYGKEHARYDDAVSLYDFLESYYLKKQKPDDAVKISKPALKLTTQKPTENPKEFSDKSWRSKPNNVGHSILKNPDTIDSLLNRMQDVLRLSVSEMKKLVSKVSTNVSQSQENNGYVPPCKKSNALPQYLGSVYDDVADFYDKTNTAYEERRRKKDEAKKPNRRVYLVIEDADKDEMDDRQPEIERRFFPYSNFNPDTSGNDPVSKIISYLIAAGKQYTPENDILESFYRG